MMLSNASFPGAASRRGDYPRGPDLSESLEGAGGIGGLLARTDNPSTLISSPPRPPHAYYHADGNGNVTMLVQTNQGVGAKYVYDPYGGLLSLAGPLAEANLYRFSSKELHAASGLVYYLYRFYDANLQRWISRDPLGDAGSRTSSVGRNAIPEKVFGANLHFPLRNDPVNAYDPDGRIAPVVVVCVVVAGVVLCGCRKGPKPPQFPSTDPCMSKAELQADVSNWRNCQSASGDGSIECSAICDCMAGGNSSISRDACWKECTDQYEQRCP